MTNEEAIDIARGWVAQRKEVRRHLVEVARERNPVPEGAEWPSAEVRKLYQYPADLSEERLLKLIGENEPCIHPGIFNFNDAPTQYCWNCGRDVPRHEL